MTILAVLIPVSLLLGCVGLVAFVWSLRSGQYDDLDGAGWRIFLDEAEEDGRAARGEAPGHD